MVLLGSKPNKPTELVFPMNGLIHFNGNVCTYVFVCVRACREENHSSPFSLWTIPYGMPRYPVYQLFYKEPEIKSLRKV